MICYPSLLELWLECGGRVVGVHTPAPGEQLPSGAEQAVPVGRFFHPSPEKIIQLEPDLVILNALARGNPMLANLLKRSGIRVLLLSYENYSDYRKIAALFCRLQGKKNAPDSVATVERDVKTIMDRCAGRKNPPRFLVFFFNGANFRAETSLAHTAYIAEALGGINALAPGQRPVSAHRVSFSREKLLLEDPDLILIVPATKNKKLFQAALDHFREDPALRTLKAFRNGRIIVLPTELFQYKPNRRFPEAFRMMESYLYPPETKQSAP